MTGPRPIGPVKEKKAQSTQTNPTYTLTKGQAAKVASLSVTLDERGKKVLARAFDLGLKCLEEQAAAQ